MLTANIVIDAVLSLIALAICILAVTQASWGLFFSTLCFLGLMSWLLVLDIKKSMLK